MPTYEYHCEKCKKGFEIFQSMKDDALSVCPQEACRMRTWGKGRVKRQLGTGAGLIFKGSGFYITDYRSEGYKSAAKKEAGAGESKSSGGGGGESGGISGESKPAAPASTPTPPAKKKSRGKDS